VNNAALLEDLYEKLHSRRVQIEDVIWKIDKFGHLLDRAVAEEYRTELKTIADRLRLLEGKTESRLKE
jgi:hypothetical protein